MSLISPLRPPLVDPLGRPLSGGGLPWEGGGGAAPNPYSPAASAIQLPYTAIWISQQGVTTADDGATVEIWASYLGGIACTMTAPAATNRPAYSASGGTGGRPLITADGTDNCLGGVMTKGSNWTSFESGMVGSRVTFGSSGDMSTGIITAGVYSIGTGDNTAATFRTGAAAAGTAVSTSDPDGVTAHWSGDHPGGTASNNVRKNGTIEASGASGAFSSKADGSTVCIGGNSVGLIGFGNWAYQAVYYGPALTAAQRTYLRALLTYWTGVAS